MLQVEDKSFLSKYSEAGDLETTSQDQDRSLPYLCIIKKLSITRDNCVNLCRSLLGVFLVFLLVSDYSLQSQILQYFYSRIEVPFKNYFVLCYLANATLIFNFLPFITLRCLRVTKRVLFVMRSSSETEYDFSNNLEIATDFGSIQSQSAYNYKYQGSMMEDMMEDENDAEDKNTSIDDDSCAQTQESEIQVYTSWKYLLLIAFLLAPFQIYSGWLWYLSLDYIPVSLEMSLYQSSLIFVFILGFFILRERIDLCKLIILAVLISGVILMFFGGSEDDKDKVYDNPMVGCICILVSALFEALYSIFYSKWMPSNLSLEDFFLFQFFMGLGIALIHWPAIIVLHYAGFETIPFSEIGIGWISIILAGGMSTFCYSGLISGALTVTGSAIYVSIASMLVIPVTSAVDFLWHKAQFKTLTIIGITAIFVGSIFQIIVQLARIEILPIGIDTFIIQYQKIFSKSDLKPPSRRIRKINQV